MLCRVQDAGVVLTATNTVIAELAQNWSTPERQQLIELLFTEVLAPISAYCQGGARARPPTRLLAPQRAACGRRARSNSEARKGFAMKERKPVAVVAGAGPGNGAALGRRFANGGYAVALLARHVAKIAEVAGKIDGAVAYACDVSDPASVAAAFDTITAELGVVDVLLFNAGSGVFKSIEEITPAEFEAARRVNAYGSLLCSQAVIPAMKARGSGTILFTGATASLRGGRTTAAFAPAKAAQRSLAESMARTLWPVGIHVGLHDRGRRGRSARHKAGHARQESRFLRGPGRAGGDGLVPSASGAPGVELRGRGTSLRRELVVAPATT